VCGGRGGREVQERVVGGEVVPVVDTGYVVEIGVLDEGEVVPRGVRSGDLGKGKGKLTWCTLVC
jgi:hypothetical protein